MKRFITLLVGLALMVGPSAAFAQSSSSECQTYSSETCSVTETSGTLPFTGLDVPVLIAVGGGLLGVGFAVRRISRQPS